MRKSFYLLLFTLLLTSQGVWSQSIVVTSPQCRNAVVEEYTGIHCGYCPDGHKRADSLNKTYPGRVVLINIHQGGYATPGAGEPDFRTIFGDALASQAGVTGYPSGTVNRHVFPNLNAAATTLNRGQWFSAANQVFPLQSPVNVGFTSVFDTLTRQLTVTVEVYYTKNSPLATNYINVALLENNVIGYQTDYANGNTNTYNHKHILRHLVTGQWGDPVTTTTKGYFFSKVYNYTVPAGFKIENCDVAVFVAESHQEIYTGFVAKADGGSADGKTTTYIGDFTLQNAPAVKGTPAVASDFNIVASSSFSNTEEFKISLDSKAPAGWIAGFQINSINYTDTARVNISPSANLNINLQVTPGTAHGIGEYTLLMEYVNDPMAPAKILATYVISGVTDLIVTNDAPWGDSDDTTDAGSFKHHYSEGLGLAGCNTYTHTLQEIMKVLGSSNALGGVDNIWFNVGWSFPSLTDSNVKYLTSFLNNGGNFFISGQDIGWETWNTDNPYGTNATKAFFTNYLNAGWVSDGSTTQNLLNPVATDLIFGTSGSSAIVNRYGANPQSGTLYMYPDVLTVTATGVPVFYYNTNQSSIAVVRSNNKTYKSVYMGVSLEMISDQATRNKIMKLSYDWFSGLISSVEFDKLAGELNYFPNPANDFFVLTLDQPHDALVLKMFDMNGRLVVEQMAGKAEDKLMVDCRFLQDGLYLLQLSDGNGFEKSAKVLISK